MEKTTLRCGGVQFRDPPAGVRLEVSMTEARRWMPLLGAGMGVRENCSAYLEQLVSDSLIL